MFSGLATLSRWRSTRTDRRTGGHINTLPNELLGAILERALEPNYTHQPRCTPQEFPGYQLKGTIHRLCPGTLNSEPLAEEGSYAFSTSTHKQLRLVCRLWKELADDHSYPCYSTYQFQNNVTPHWRVRKVDFHWSPELFAGVANPYQSLENLLSGAGSLNYLTHVTISDRLQEGNWDLSAVATLFNYSSNLPRVTFLVLEIDEFQHAPLDGQIVWNSISSRFPQLLSLAVRISSKTPLTGCVHLNNLESLTLMTHHQVTSHITWTLPNLRHLSAYCGDPSIYTGILDTYHDQLTSILLSEWTAQLRFRGRFWNKYPRLEVLGAPLNTIRPLLSDISEPPIEHPFNHVCVMEDQGLSDPQSPELHDEEYYEQMLQAIPNWRSIHFLSLATLAVFGS